MRKKRCKICSRSIRSHNKSGYCQSCYIKVWNGGDNGYFNKKDSKVYKLKSIGTIKVKQWEKN